MSDSHHAAADDGMIHSHIEPVSHYLKIFSGLIFFTLVTVGLSYIHLGALNLAIAIFIASIKATLVVVFFMHLRHDNKFNATFFVCRLMSICVFFAYTTNDTARRENEINDVSGNHVYLGESEKHAPGGFEPPKRIVEGAKEKPEGTTKSEHH